MSYLSDMRALIVLFCLISGCTPRPIEPVPKTHSTPIRKSKRMVCNTNTVVIAVIDTGFSFSPLTRNAKLCKFGHKNFTENMDSYLPPGYNDPVPVDNHGHGTNVVGLIQDNASEANYCMLILKYYDPKDKNGNNLENTIKAISYATNLGVKYINYSGGGTESDSREREVVKKFLDAGGKFIAAAGNERKDIDKTAFYPAMDDDRIVRVGSIEDDGEISGYSNYGSSVTRWEHGTKAIGFGTMLSGTSQAAAIATGKIVKETECNK